MSKESPQKHKKQKVNEDDSKPPKHANKKKKGKPSYYILRELASAGCTNGIASAILNPMDVTKVRMQTEGALSRELSQTRKYKTFIGTAKTIIKEEGILGLWLPGLLPSMMRELSYSSMRMGLYTPIRNIFIGKNVNKNQDIGLFKKICAGLVTGATGSAIATPTDLVKIRFQQEAGKIVNGIYVSGLRKGHAPSYSNTFAAFYGIFKLYGFRGLYKGCTPTIARAALLTSAQLSSYDHTKYVLKHKNILSEGITLHVVASLVAGFCATTACAPADLVKTRIMCDADHKLYKNPIDCAIKTVKHDGPLALFRGWTPSYARIGPHFIIAFPLLEQLRKLFGLGWFAS